MKKNNLIAILPILIILAFSVFQSCKEDPCKEVNCLNGGTCVDGRCECVGDYFGLSCEQLPDVDYNGDCAISGTKNCGTSESYDGDILVSGYDKANPSFVIRVLSIDVSVDFNNANNSFANKPNIPSFLMDSVWGQFNANGIELNFLTTESVGGIATTCSYETNCVR